MLPLSLSLLLFFFSFSFLTGGWGKSKEELMRGKWFDGRWEIKA